MFFNLCFPAIDPWSDWDELVAAAEELAAARRQGSAGAGSGASTPDEGRHDQELQLPGQLAAAGAR